MSAVVDFPDEVVTQSLVSYVRLPGAAAELAVITLDNGHDHTRPSTLGPAGLASLDAALDAIAARVPSVAAIAVTGKPFVFCVGADLTGVALINDAKQARQIARLGHRVFGRLLTSSVPTFAFVNGVVLGGGLELALHCHYRTIAASAGAVGFPEVFLGLVPGWGGSQLLPRLVGPDSAVTVVIENALNQNLTLRPSQARELGLFDALLDDADFLVQSLRWAGEVLAGAHRVTQPDIDAAAWAPAVARGRAIADAKVHGAAPAANRALDLIELAETADPVAGARAEDDALSELIMSDEFRSGAYAFDLTQHRARRPAGAPDRGAARAVTKVGVIGAGLMASQLALLFIRQLDVPVVVTDVDPNRVEAALAYVQAEIAKLLERGRISADRANRLRANISGTLDRAAFADADFVIEAVYEDLDVKRTVFGEIEKFVSAEAILATNTSSLSITAMAAGLAHPERVVGFHFFNPVAVLPLLEIVRGERTDDTSLATAFAVARSLKKSSVLVKDAPAFVVNRLLTRLLGEVFAAVDEGTDLVIADNALDDLGLPMSPFALLALVGPAVASHVAQTLHAAFPDRFGVSINLQALVAAGKPGIYRWDERGRPSIDPDVTALLVQRDEPSTREQVRDRALSALAQEIRLMLDDGVVASAADVDLCLLLGAGWPFHLGGITPYLDRSGVAERVTGSRFLPPGVASVRTASVGAESVAPNSARQG